MIAPMALAYRIPAPSLRVSHRIILPSALYEFREPGKQKLAISELAPAETFAASPPQISGYEVPLRSKLLTERPFNFTRKINRSNGVRE